MRPVRPIPRRNEVDIDGRKDTRNKTYTENTATERLCPKPPSRCSPSLAIQYEEGKALSSASHGKSRHRSSSGARACPSTWCSWALMSAHEHQGGRSSAC